MVFSLCATTTCAQTETSAEVASQAKLSIGEHVHYRDFTRNRPKGVAGKVTGHVGMKMFIVQGPHGHCRRHEDQLKLRSFPKLNRQRRLNRSTAFDSERHTKTDQQCEKQCSWICCSATGRGREQRTACSR